MTKEFWEKLEVRYTSEDATNKKFLVSRFNNFKIVGEISIIEQFHKLEQILNMFKQHNLNMDEFISISSIIDKLTPLMERNEKESQT